MDRPDMGFRVAGTCFVIAGLLLLVLSGLEAAQQLRVLNYRDASAQGTVAELDPSGSLFVSFKAANGEDVRFEHNTILSVISYAPPYVLGDAVAVQYRSKNIGDAGIVDSREWFGIAILGLLGLFFAVWGWLIRRFAVWGGLGGLVGMIALVTSGNSAVAAVLQYFGH